MVSYYLHWLGKEQSQKQEMPQKRNERTKNQEDVYLDLTILHKKVALDSEARLLLLT